MMCVICVLCLIAVPLPPGENPFVVKYKYNIIYLTVLFSITKIHPLPQNLQPVFQSQNTSMERY
jgi:hypothetical protein